MITDLHSTGKINILLFVMSLVLFKSPKMRKNTCILSGSVVKLQAVERRVDKDWSNPVFVC